MRQLAILLLLSCAACTTGAQGPVPASGPVTRSPVLAGVPAPGAQKPEPSGTLAQIKSLIGSATCTDSAQCHSLPIGARACGGPESYLPWSSATTSDAALRPLAERYKDERRAQLNASGAISDCRFIADPGAVCQAGTCQLGAGQPAIR